MVDQHRTAVVISGGTAKGAYAAGYLTEIFKEAQLASRVDLLSGTSTGALIAPMLALHCLRARQGKHQGEDLLECIRANYRVPSEAVFRDEPRKIRNRILSCALGCIMRDHTLGRMLGMIWETGAAVDTERLHGVIRTQLTDKRVGELIAGAEQVECLVNCVSAQSGELRAFSTRDAAMNPSLFRDAVYASCLQPLFMPLHEVGAAQPREEYMDGGILDVVPVHEAWAKGASRVLAVALTPKGAQKKTERYSGKGLGRVFALLMRVLRDLLMGEVGDGDLTEARRAAALGKMVLLARKHGVANGDIDKALEDLKPDEQLLTNREHPLSELYVHRPADNAPLEEEFRWTVKGMNASILAGQRAAEADVQVRRFLVAPAPVAAPLHSLTRGMTPPPPPSQEAS